MFQQSPITKLLPEWLSFEFERFGRAQRYRVFGYSSQTHVVQCYLLMAFVLILNYILRLYFNMKLNAPVKHF